MEFAGISNDGNSLPISFAYLRTVADGSSAGPVWE